MADNYLTGLLDQTVSTIAERQFTGALERLGGVVCGSGFWDAGGK